MIAEAASRPGSGSGSGSGLSRQDELIEAEACRYDCVHFVDTYGMIDDAQHLSGNASGAMRFRLWPPQARVVWTLQKSRHVIILKARQLGISWIICAYVLWRCLVAPGVEVLLFSRGKKEAKELLRRIRSIYVRLPAWLRESFPALLGPGSKEELAWVNGSRVQSMASTPNSGVSFTASIVVLDEAAKMAHGEDLYSTVKPTVDAGNGQMIVLSTAHGAGGFFYSLWVDSQRGLNTFSRIFLPWWSRPGRDHDWYERILADATDKKKVRQEYPANPIEAFLVSGRTRFDSDCVVAQSANLRTPLPVNDWPEALFRRPGWIGLEASWLPATLRDIPGLRIYRAPVAGRRYLIAGDVAEGKVDTSRPSSDPDYCAAILVDVETWEEYASLHGRWEPDEYASYLMALSEPYAATVIVERNSHGHAVLATMRLRRFPRIAEGHDDYQGWLTNLQTKPQMIDLLAAALRDRLIAIRTRAALSEFQTYAVLKNGGTGARSGSHDDFVMAWAIALAYLRHAASHAPPANYKPFGADADPGRRTAPAAYPRLTP